MATAAAVVGGSIIGGVMSSKSQEKAAKTQAQSIQAGQAISAEAAKQARQDVLATYAPAFRDVAEGVQNARNDLLAGRVLTSDLLNDAFLGAASTFQTSAQNAMQALVGSPQPVQQGAAIQGRTGPSIPAGQRSALRPSGVQDPRWEKTSDQMKRIREQKVDYGDKPVDRKKLREYSGKNKRVQQDIDSQPWLSPEDKTKLKRLAAQGKNLGDAYQEATGFATKKEAQQAYQQERAILGAAPEIQGDMRALPSAAQQNLGLQAPGGQYGLGGAESALRAAERRQLGEYDFAAQQAIDASRAGFGQARRDISSAGEQALGFYDPYRQAGEGALEREAALTGAMGPEAQARAFAEYSESPGQKYMREQQEKALLRSSAAIGGLGGGNVRTALQEQAAGIASQNYQQDLENLRSLAGRGQQAAGASADISQNQGAALAQMARERGLTESQINQMLGQQRAGTIGQTGQAVSGMRYGTGQDISRMLLGAGGQLSQLQTGLGSQLANIDQQTAANLANLSAQYGQQTSGLRTGLGSTLANIGVGQGSQQANLMTQLGQAQAAGVTNPWGNTISQLTGMIAMNPSLLSSNPVPVG